jgi:hypothetical protein
MVGGGVVDGEVVDGEWERSGLRPQQICCMHHCHMLNSSSHVMRCLIARQLLSHVHKSNVRTDMSISSLLPNSFDPDRIEGLLV